MVNNFSVEIKISVFTFVKRLFNLINFFLTFFVTERVAKSEINSLRWGHTKHMLETHSKLVILIVEIVYFGEYLPPGGLRVRQRPKNRFQALTVKFLLIVKVLESEC